MLIPLAAVMDDFMVMCKHALDLLHELVHMVERKRTKVTVVALIEIVVIDVDNLSCG